MLGLEALRPKAWVGADVDLISRQRNDGVMNGLKCLGDHGRTNRAGRVAAAKGQQVAPEAGRYWRGWQ